MTPGTRWPSRNCWLSTKLFTYQVQGVPMFQVGFQVGLFQGAASANISHCVKINFLPTRSKGCPFRFQVGLQVGLFWGGWASANIPHCVKINFLPTRSKGCPFRFQVGFHVGLFQGGSASANYYSMFDFFICTYIQRKRNTDNCFTSSDPHHEIYTFCYWQIFWHSI